MDNKVTPPQIIIMASGAAMLLGSFLKFFGDDNAWSSGGLPIITLAAWIGIAMAVIIALQAFANVTLPDRVLTFTWAQLHLVLSIYAALLMIGWLLLKTGGVSPDRGAGFWLMFLAAAGLVVGAVMLRNESPAAAGGSTPPTTF